MCYNSVIKTEEGIHMNCVNCNTRLFLFNETEELFPGSEAVFCASCRKKIAPFLEETNHYETHAEHLAAWKQELSARGITPRGMNALSAYCAYLDRITPRKTEPITGTSTPQGNLPARPTQPPVAVVPVKEVTGQLVEMQNKVDTLSGRITHMARVLRFALWSAVASGIAGVGSLIALLASLIAGG